MAATRLVHIFDVFELHSHFVFFVRYSQDGELYRARVLCVTEDTVEVR